MRSRRGPRDSQNYPLLTQTGAAASEEDALVLVEDQLDDLVLEDHEHGDVGRLGLRSEQRGAEDDGHVLHRHTIVVAIVNHPVGERRALSDASAQLAEGKQEVDASGVAHLRKWPKRSFMVSWLGTGSDLTSS